MSRQQRIIRGLLPVIGSLLLVVALLPLLRDGRIQGQTGIQRVDTTTANALIMPLVENSDTYRTLREVTPQFRTLADSEVILLFEIVQPVGLCEVEIERLDEIDAIRTGALNQVRIPDGLVFWKLRADAQDNPQGAWEPHAFAYNPIANSLVFGCFEPATYLWHNGDIPTSYNPALSDAGSLMRSSTMTGWHLLAGVMGLLLLAMSYLQRQAERI